MTKTWPGSLALAGAGKMGGALLRGWLAGGLAPSIVRIADPYIDKVTTDFWRSQQVIVETIFSTPSPPTTPPDVLVLAMKPQSFSEAPDYYAPLAGPETLVVSILAGKTLADLRAGLPDAGAIIRAMPNLPVSVGRGVSGLSGEPGKLTPRHKAVATTLMEAVGLAEWIDESLIDALTAVSGSGPAYVFLLAESLAEAGVAAGLPADVATRLARATVEGSAALMQAQPDVPAAKLRENVTSPGGTTAEALAILRAPDGLTPLMERAIAAAKRRAGELAG